MLAAAAVVLAACGGASKPEDPTVAANQACTPAGTNLAISADNIAFDKSCLAAPAGQDLTITFENKEAIPHDVVILKAGSSSPLFSGDIVTGPRTVTYRVTALGAGTYRFQCSVHPTQMKGTFVVR